MACGAWIGPGRRSSFASEFFDAELHPTISLRARDVGRSRLGGELTIRGATRPVELELTMEPVDDGAVRARAETRIRRSDFGLEWAALRDAGRLLVADEVRLVADVVLTRGPGLYGSGAGHGQS